ncbi:hypothetical protein PUV47_17560 [Pseudovibrio exalbescens]|uniref:COG4223 family protein n=1 Tax=Pseudovibrio exalbescens TaxID=197461 RepID=UPI0023671258|nr:hypothetical protein [Pseudovibrio exalbescens]MDD7911744.1 hypothetical protein [Pseudovibrio exalbescens]
MAADKPKTGDTGSGSSTNRSAGARPSGRRPARKNVTIDLEAKEVKASLAEEQEAKAEAAKAAEAAKEAANPAKDKAAEAKPEAPKPEAAKADPTKKPEEATKPAAAAKAAEPEKKSGDGPLKGAAEKAAEPTKPDASASTAGAKTGADKPKEAAAPKANDKKPEDSKTADKPKQAAPAGAVANASASQKQSGAGLGSLIAAGVIGGLVVLGGGYGLQQMGVLSLASQQQEEQQTALQQLVAASQDRVETLEQQISDLRASVTAAPAQDLFDELRERVASAEESASASFDQMRDILGATYDTQVQELAKGVEELRGFVNEGAAGDGAAVSSLRATLEEVQAQIAALSEAGQGASEEALEAVKAQVATLQEQAAQLQEEAGSLAQLPETVRSQQQLVTSLETRIAQTAANLQAQVQTQAETRVQMDALVSQLQSLSDTVTAQLDRLEQRVGDASAQERAARAIAIASLQAAVEGGRPYATELSAVEAVMTGDKSQLAPLKEYASSGIPTRSQLIARFGGAARAMSAADVTSQSEGVVDRLMNSAQSLVSIRTPGDNEGTTPRDRLGSMEARVASGDLEGALAAYDQLPEPVKAAGATWAGQVRARLQADALVAKVTDEVLKSLAAASQQ